MGFKSHLVGLRIFTITYVPLFSPHSYPAHDIQCDTTACDVAEWKAIAQGNGTILDLLALEQSTNVRHLLSLHHDPYMFHQANLRQADVAVTTLGQGITAKSGKWSLFQMWVEIVLAELERV